MAFVKVVKNRAYFKRFQVKYRRRREGKTDYGARRVMVRQEKNKYNSAKYRLIVRFTNKRCIAQIVSSTIEGDKVMMHADSTQLEKYGLKVGLKNYAAGYCVGLLLARRTLDKVGLADAFEGQKEPDGEEFHVEASGDARPFKCYLDTGLVRTSTGARVFSALKGATDGGLDIPHNDKRFAGYDVQDKSLDSETLERYIKGGVTAEYAEEMQEEEPEKFQEHFKKYLDEDQDPTELEERMDEVFEAMEALEAKIQCVAEVLEDAEAVEQMKRDGSYTAADLEAKHGITAANWADYLEFAKFLYECGDYEGAREVTMQWVSHTPRPRPAPALRRDVTSTRQPSSKAA